MPAHAGQVGGCTRGKTLYNIMILVRAPLRISFLGGGTDLPGFYRYYPGRVISATIDKFVYVAINSVPLMDKLIVKYQKTELVSHPNELEHPSIRAALLDLDITDRGIEIGSFADLPSKTGLGSSSSFAVALMKGLQAYLRKRISTEEAARAACRLEIDLLREPIGKQDQYAAAFGGINLFQFNTDETVRVEPVFLDYQKRLLLQDHLLLFFTGITRSSSSVLEEQSVKIRDNINRLLRPNKRLDTMDTYRKGILAGTKSAGSFIMRHRGLCEIWLYRKRFSYRRNGHVLLCTFNQ